MSCTVSDSVNREAAASIFGSVPITRPAESISLCSMRPGRCFRDFKSGSVAATSAPAAQADGASGKRPTTCASSDDMISIPAITASEFPAACCVAAAFPALLWSQTAIIASPHSTAAATIAGGVISGAAHGERAV